MGVAAAGEPADEGGQLRDVDGRPVQAPIAEIFPEQLEMVGLGLDGEWAAADVAPERKVDRMGSIG
jgi:hypothetical protein